MRTKSKTIIRAVTVSQSTGFYVDLIPDLQTRGYEVVSLTSPGPELQKIREMGAKVIEVPMERHISVTKDIKSLFQIIKVIRKEKPYMVHSMTPKAGLLCMIASWLCRVPRRVHTFTGLVWPTSTGLSRKILIFTDWVTCFCATHIIPEGKGVMDDLQKYVTNKPMKVLGHGNVKGVDMVKFSRRPEIEQQARDLRKIGFTFLFVGRLVGDKGINELVSAFVRLNERYPDTHLLLIGAREENLDPLKAETWSIIHSNNAIEELGPKYGDELLAYYAASDCFILPSYREGFPNTVLEAGAMGLPCVVTDINGSREIIENGKNGLVVPSKNADALYSAMEKIVKFDLDTAEMAKKARPMIEMRFEQGYVRKCLLEFYEEIM